MKRQYVRVILCIIMILYGRGAVKTMASSAYGYILPLSSTACLSDADVSDMPLQIISYAKNEIYARNGRMFHSEELQNYFNQQYWYTPVYEPEQFTLDMLSTVEMDNATMLMELEESYGFYQLDMPGYSYEPVYEYIAAHSGISGGYDVDPDSYIFYDSDRRLLTAEELEPLCLQELCYARNEIYARHGRLFDSAELSGYFEQKNWYYGYVASWQFSDSELNECEMSNVQALMDAEYSRSAAGYELDVPGYEYSRIGSYTSYAVYEQNSEDYIFWDSNIRYLTDYDVAGLSLQQICYAKNEIYARRGYMFNSQELREYFGRKGWYHGTIPGASFSSSVFNDYEVANIELLQGYEYGISPNGYQLY